MASTSHPGQVLRDQLNSGGTIDPFLGVYDSFSASIASAYSPNLFLSGFGFSASYYGLPDVGFVAWSDIVGAAWRIRQILPEHNLLVDIDDGFVDVHTACHVVSQLDQMGVAMVMLEDQARPRRCGHADGKRILPLADYVEKLNAVLDHRGQMCVLARTDASGDEIFRRVDALSATRADVILVDGIHSAEMLAQVVARSGKPILFNQIAGGKSPALSITELRQIGVRLIQYSTPLLFAVQSALTHSLDQLFDQDGLLAYSRTAGDIGVQECTALLQANMR